MAIRRENASVVVELPDQRAIGVPVGAMQSEVASCFGGQIRVGFLHAGSSRFEVEITARLAESGLTDVLDPAAEALGRGLVDPMRNGQTQAFDRGRLADAIP